MGGGGGDEKLGSWRPWVLPLESLHLSPFSPLWPQRARESVERERELKREEEGEGEGDVCVYLFMCKLGWFV